MMSDRLRISDISSQRHEEIKLLTGLSAFKITDRAYELLYNDLFPENLTEEQKERLKREFESEKIRALDTKYNQQSFIVTNARQKCMFRNYLSFVYDQAVPFVVIKHHVKTANELIRNITFLELLPMLIEEYTDFAEECRTPEKFKLSMKKLNKHMKEHNISISKIENNWQ